MTLPASPSPLTESAVITAAGERAAEYLSGWLAGRDLPPRLRDALTYVLAGGGKRLRPALCLTVCDALGGSRGAALPAAAALELVHDFSLVHDDLPALDDDDLRRGRATLHRHTDEATAILAGDALLALSTSLIAEEVGDGALARTLLGELSRATVDMIAGQVLDTFPGDGFRGSESAAGRAEHLARIHRLKTGALIRAACRLGAQCAGASASDLAAATSYGEAVGLMFQIVDDILDVTQTTAHLGKAAGKDLARGKLTYPRVHGLDGARAEIERSRDAARSALAAWRNFSGDRGTAARALLELCDSLAVRTR